MKRLFLVMLASAIVLCGCKTDKKDLPEGDRTSISADFPTNDLGDRAMPEYKPYWKK